MPTTGSTAAEEPATEASAAAERNAAAGLAASRSDVARTLSLHITTRLYVGWGAAFGCEVTGDVADDTAKPCVVYAAVGTPLITAIETCDDVELTARPVLEADRYQGAVCIRTGEVCAWWQVMDASPCGAAAARAPREVTQDQPGI